MKRNTLLIAVILGLVASGNRAIVHAEGDGSDFKWNSNLTTGLITDAGTGLQFRKICGLVGKKDVIEYASGLQLSSNGKFLLQHNVIVPLENGE